MTWGQLVAANQTHQLRCRESFEKKSIPRTCCQLSCVSVSFLLVPPTRHLLNTTEKHRPGFIQERRQLQIMGSNPQNPEAAAQTQAMYSVSGVSSKYLTRSPPPPTRHLNPQQH
jgi:hypothetical protein